MKKKIYIIAFIYLTAVFAFLAGMYVVMAQKWPYEHVMNLRNFILGDEEEKKTVLEKIENDLGLKPSRVIESYRIDAAERERYSSVDLRLKNSRREAPLIFLGDKRGSALRFIYGALDTTHALHGALLLDADGAVVHQWHLSDSEDKDPTRGDGNKYLHGMEVFPDGSLIFSFDGGKGIYKVNACGELIWSIRGNFHHSVAQDAAGAVWAWRNHDLVKIDVDTGAILRTLSLGAIDKANADTDLFGIRQHDKKDRSVWAHDPHHPNDAEPLTHRHAEGFPGFTPGDLLISLRSTNLVFIMDPETLRIKWWRIGQWRRQHDPDWASNGEIYVYDNNMHRGFSHIVRIHPAAMEAERVVDGERFNFASSVMGTQDVLDSGSILVTSPKQGRVFEVTGTEKTFEFINSYNEGEGEVLVVTGAKFLVNNFFESAVFERCE